MDSVTIHTAQYIVSIYSYIYSYSYRSYIVTVCSVYGKTVHINYIALATHYSHTKLSHLYIIIATLLLVTIL